MYEKRQKGVWDIIIGDLQIKFEPCPVEMPLLTIIVREVSPGIIGCTGSSTLVSHSQVLPYPRYMKSCHKVQGWYHRKIMLSHTVTTFFFVKFSSSTWSMNKSLSIVEFVHTETQDRNTIMDA